MATMRKSLGTILSDFLMAVSSKRHMTEEEPSLLQAILGIYNNITYSDSMPDSIMSFLLDDESTSEAIRLLKAKLENTNPLCLKLLNNPISYLLDELICNIQQHAQTKMGYAYMGYDSSTDMIEAVIADQGITIYGSYVAAQKHLDMLDDTDASALNLAQSGYSIKNLPETENRGYGISSNIRMIVEGLNGEFALFSGNALLFQFSERKKILSLPPETDFKGTMIIVRFPAMLPNNFSLYNFIG